MLQRRGVLWIFSAPSGTGKSTIAQAITAADPTIHLSVSYTTRAPRATEIHGHHYVFCDDALFSTMVDDGGFLEYATVFHHRYGTPAAPIKAMLEKGQDVICDVDWQGGDSIAAQLPLDTVRIFIVPPSLEALKLRLTRRGQDSSTSIAHRLSQAKQDLHHAASYDYVVLNGTMSIAIADIQAIIRGERLRRSRVQNMDTFIDSF